MLQLNVDFLSYDKIASEAHRLLAAHGCEKSLPVPIEEIVEYKLKADIVPIPGLQRIFEIEGATSRDLTTVYVDEFIYKNRPARYRFTLGHESGHITLHEKYFSQLDFDSVEGWKRLEEELDPDDYSRLETQGYMFGGLVLVPRHHLRSKFEEKLIEIRPMVDKAKSLGLSKDTYIDAAVDRMSIILAPSFDVSAEVIARRIGYDKLESLIP